ncbi:uncharacterized protein [Drosophila bipectinata]|uniref:uncharacterized protein n=1 Tax=Drosophila bipectinata TaxID=42026 RepID=UPI001C8A2E02|nr:uncharacterized protein LOC108133458 [Drosophila bipectinata]
MRSLFSSRYSNSRKEFYERYEAARILHPDLPLCERPVEPARKEIVDCSIRRRYKSYRELGNQTTEQWQSEAWLSNDRLPIVVRRSIETRTSRVLLPRYDPSTATHEFSHNGRPQRGRRPGTSAIAKCASDFAKQVGGYQSSRSPSPVPELDPLRLDYSDEDDNRNINIVLSDDSDIEFVEFKTKMPSPFFPSSPSSDSDGDADAMPQSLELAPKVKGKRGRPPKNVLPVYGCGFYDVNANKENIPPTNCHDLDTNNSPRASTMRGRPKFLCPIPTCGQVFALRRLLYKHQRDAGHHNWTHKCDKCGQIFRTAGFKRMHAEAACERNLLKKKPKTK